MSLRETFKNLLAELLYRSGLLARLVQRKFRGRAVVLTYHRVLPPEVLQTSYSHPAIVVAPALFARHIAVLKRLFVCLGIEQFTARLQQRNFAGAAYCLITFDDAWRDNYTYAFEILKRQRTPAVIFVPVDYIGSGKLFWQERLGHIVERLCTQAPEIAASHLKALGWDSLPALPLTQRRTAIRAAIRDIKHKGYAEIDALMATLEAAVDAPVRDYGPDGYLSVEHMRVMARDGISFQSHACSHRILTRLPADEIAAELQRSREWLHERLGTQPSALAYPNGDYSPEVQRLAAQAGYQTGFTTVNGAVELAGDPYTVRRINLNDNAAGSEARLLLTLLLAS